MDFFIDEKGRYFLDEIEEFNPNKHKIDEYVVVELGDVITHTLMAMENLVKDGYTDYKMQLACLLHDIGKPKTQVIRENGRISNHGHELEGEKYSKEILRSLKYSNDDRDFVSTLIGNHMRIKKLKEMRKSKKIKLLSNPLIDSIVALSSADTRACLGSDAKLEISYIQKEIDNFKEELSSNVKMLEPLITGKDLIDIGMKPGKLFKEVLSEVFNLQLDGEITNKKEAFSFIMGYVLDPDRD